MSKLKGVGLVVGAFFISMLNLNAYAANTGAYIQLSSTVSQAASAKENIAVFDTIEGGNGIERLRDKITFNVAGTYFVMVQGQAAAVKSGSQATGSVDVWLRQNDKPLGNSTSRGTVAPGSTGTLVTEDILQVKPGDTVSVGFGASVPELGFAAIPVTATVPGIPSIVITVYKID